MNTFSLFEQLFTRPYKNNLVFLLFSYSFKELVVNLLLLFCQPVDFETKRAYSLKVEAANVHIDRSSSAMGLSRTQ